jgi:hypothetical protein
VHPAAGLTLYPEAPGRLALQLGRPLPEWTYIGHILVAMQMDMELQTTYAVVPEQGPMVPIPLPGAVLQMHEVAG